MVTFILISGKYRTGKSYLSKELRKYLIKSKNKYKNNYYVINLSFALPLKNNFCKNNNLTLQELERNKKKLRNSLNTFAKMLKEKDKYIFIKETISNINYFINKYSNFAFSKNKNLIFIFDDFRFIYEYNFIKNYLEKLNIDYKIINIKITDNLKKNEYYLYEEEKIDKVKSNFFNLILDSNVIKYDKVNRNIIVKMIKEIILN